MENKNVGWLLFGISFFIIIIILIFYGTSKDIVNASCTLAHGDAKSCPVYKTINDQIYLALAIVGILVIISFFLMFSRPKDKIIIKRIKEPQTLTEVNLSEFNEEEKQIFNMLKDQGAVFQSDVVEKSGMNKSKVTRILDRLEGKGLIERKRRGMTNMIVINDNVKIKE